MRTDERWLRDIIVATDEIAEFVDNIEKSRFLNSPMIQRAVLYDLIIIGEASNRVSNELQSRHATINWRGAIAMRNYAAHEYFSVTLDRVWITVTMVLPEFREQIARLLQQEFPGSDSA